MRERGEHQSGHAKMGRVYPSTDQLQGVQQEGGGGISTIPRAWGGIRSKGMMKVIDNNDTK